jgi:hypothetical protein
VKIKSLEIELDEEAYRALSLYLEQHITPHKAKWFFRLLAQAALEHIAAYEPPLYDSHAEHDYLLPPETE